MASSSTDQSAAHTSRVGYVVSEGRLADTNLPFLIHWGYVDLDDTFKFGTFEISSTRRTEGPVPRPRLARFDGDRMVQSGAIESIADELNRMFNGSWVASQNTLTNKVRSVFTHLRMHVAWRHLHAGVAAERGPWADLNLNLQSARIFVPSELDVVQLPERDQPAAYLSHFSKVRSAFTLLRRKKPVSFS